MILEYFCIDKKTLDVDWGSLCLKFPVFETMKTIFSHPKWHAEGSVFEHTKMVYNKGVEYIKSRCQECNIELEDFIHESDDVKLILPTLLLHDIGKTKCIIGEDGYIKSSGHEELSVQLSQEILYILPIEYRVIISCLIKMHDLRYQYKTITVKKIQQRVKYISDIISYYIHPCSKLINFYDNVLSVVFRSDFYGSIRSEELKDEDVEKDIRELRQYFYEPEMIVMVGLPGSGKNHTIQQKGWDKRHTIISRDDIRKELFGDKDCHDDDEGKVSDIFYKRLQCAINNRENIVINDTNLKRKYRKQFYDLCQIHNYRYKIQYCERPLDEIFKVRTGEKWKEVIMEKLSGIEYPTNY